MRVVLHSDDWGTYLGSFIGLAFFSNHDPVGQTAACTFANEDEIRRVVASWDCGQPPTWRAVPVETTADGYATIEHCKAAGLPGWAP
jgi:hypothetical protein